MSRCPSCHEEIESDWLVCAYCGTKLSHGVIQQGRSPDLSPWLIIGGSGVFLVGLVLVCIAVLRIGLVKFPQMWGAQINSEKSTQASEHTPVSMLNRAELEITSTNEPPEVVQSAGFSRGFGNQAYVWGKGKITRAIFRSDAGLIAIGSTTGVEMLDSKSLSTLFFLDTPDEVIDIAISHNGKIAGVSLDNGTLIAFDAQTGEIINQWALDYQQDVIKLLITPDGSRLIGYAGYNLYAWDLNGSTARLIDGGLFTPNSQGYSMSASGEQFSIGSYNGSMSGGGMSERWQNYLPLGILFTDSGPVLLRSSDITGRNEILVVYFDDQKQTEIRYRPGDATEHFVLSPDNQTLVGYTHSQITLWNPQTGERLQSYTIDWGDILDMQFDRQNQLWGTSQDDNGVYSWTLGDLQNPQYLAWPVGNKGNTVKVFFMPGTDSEIIMTTQWDSTQLIDFKTNTLLNRLPGGVPYSIFLDGSLLSLTNEKFVRLDPRNGKEIGPVTPCGLVRIILVPPYTGQFTLCLSQDGKHQVWDLYANTVHATLFMQNPEVTTLSPQGNLVLSTGSTEWQILETATGSVRAAMPVFPVYSPTPLFSADERYLVARTSDSQFTIFDTSTGQPVGPANTVSGMISTYDFSPDSQFLAVGDHTGVVTLWRPGESTPFLTYQPHKEGISLVKVSPNGEYIATSSYDGTVVLWSVAP